MLLLLERIELLFADATHVSDVTVLLDGGFGGRIVVAFVQAQMLRLLLGGLGTLDYDRLQRVGQQLGVVYVGTGKHYRQRAATCFDEQALLGAGLASIGGIGANALFVRPFLGTPRALPSIQSAACHSQLTPCSS